MSGTDDEGGGGGGGRGGRGGWGGGGGGRGGELLQGYIFLIRSMSWNQDLTAVVGSEGE